MASQPASGRLPATFGHSRLMARSLTIVTTGEDPHRSVKRERRPELAPRREATSA